MSKKEKIVYSIVILNGKKKVNATKNRSPYGRRKKTITCIKEYPIKLQPSTKWLSQMCLEERPLYLVYLGE